MKPIYVIKIWSNVFLHKKWIYDEIFTNLIDDIVFLRKKWIDIVIISSGAIVLWEHILSEKDPELSDFWHECLCASVWQAKLIKMFQDYLCKYKINSSQILVTYDDMQDFEKPFMIKTILNHNLKRGIIPIVNENNSVFVESGGIANNDKLATFIAEMLKPEKCIFLSNVDWLFDSHPNLGWKKISILWKISEKEYSYVSNQVSATWRGGMTTKLDAAKRLIKLEIPMYIANWKKPYVIRDIFEWKSVGTFFWS